MTLLFLATAALAHPSADAHLHATAAVAPCEDLTRLRRASALADAGRLVEAHAELDEVCSPDDEAARLARARLHLVERLPEPALALTEGLHSLEASVLVASALTQLGRDDEAARTLADGLARQPSVRPDHYLDAARPLSDAAALEVLQLGIATVGPIGSLQRAAAERLAALGRLDEALRLLTPSRIADRLLAGDLLAHAGQQARARREWQQALAAVEAARPSRAMDDLRHALSERLETE